MLCCIGGCSTVHSFIQFLWSNLPRVALSCMLDFSRLPTFPLAIRTCLSSLLVLILSVLFVNATCQCYVSSQGVYSACLSCLSVLRVYCTCLSYVLVLHVYPTCLFHMLTLRVYPSNLLSIHFNRQAILLFPNNCALPYLAFACPTGLLLISNDGQRSTKSVQHSTS